MHRPRTLGNMIAPWRFIMFALVMAASATLVGLSIRNGWLAVMAGFDVAAFAFLISCVPILSTREEAKIRDLAARNDGNRVLLLVITGIVMLVLLIAIAAEAVERIRNPPPRR